MERREKAANRLRQNPNPNPDPNPKDRTTLLSDMVAHTHTPGGQGSNDVRASMRGGACGEASIPAHGACGGKGWLRGALHNTGVGTPPDPPPTEATPLATC